MPSCVATRSCATTPSCATTHSYAATFSCIATQRAPRFGRARQCHRARLQHALGCTDGVLGTPAPGCGMSAKLLPLRSLVLAFPECRRHRGACACFWHNSSGLSVDVALVL
eukprot:365534-Chlamydomonas_euryale.AAC.22